MRIYLSLSVYILSLGISTGLECRLALSEKHCAQLHQQYEVLKRVYQTAETRRGASPDSYASIRRELARVSSLIGHEVPGKTRGQTEVDVNMYSADKPQAEREKAYVNDPSGHTQGEPDGGYQRKPSQASGHSKIEEEAMHTIYSNGRKCNEVVSKEKCDELLRQYSILKELYANETTKEMLNLDAYNDLHRDLTEAGISIEGKPLEKEGQYIEKKCDETIPKEECDALHKKYKVMKEMYNDVDLKKMLDPEAYSELHREMTRAGIVKGEKDEDEYMTCDESVPTKTCDSLMKKYKAMKEMYSDADLKGMLNPDAYSDLEREMKDAGIVIKKKMHDDEQRKITCDEAIPRETCDGLVKKYEVMKEMYADPDLKDMLNPDAYNDLHREMNDAGIVTGEKMYANKEEGLVCNESVPKETCDGLVKKYKVMKEMYADSDLKDMLNPDAYNDLHREMKDAGIVTEEKMYANKDGDLACDESVPKKTCDGLLKKYKLMKQMYSDPNLKDMLNPDGYSDLHREMQDAGIVTGEKTPTLTENDYVEGPCDESVPKETCERLLKTYKTMKQMYDDADLKGMLDPDAYSKLHREMVEAGMDVKGNTQHEVQSDQQKHKHPITIKQCTKDGLYRYDQHSFSFCSDGYGFVQKCPKGTMHGNSESHKGDFGARTLCSMKYLDNTEGTEN